MKINKEKLQDYMVGDTRVIKKFCLLPTYTVENNKGVWLEKVSILQEVREVMNNASMDYGYHKEWVNIKFIN